MNPETTFILDNPCPTTSILAEDLMIIENPMHERGDMIAGSVAGYPTRVANNTTNLRLFLSEQGTGLTGATPVWRTPAASEVSNTPSGTVSSTDVQSAINEISGDVTSLTSTVNAMDLTLLVPYTGATGTVDLGSQDLTTTGTITAGDFTNVVPYSGANDNVDLGSFNLSAGTVSIVDAILNPTDAATKQYVDDSISGIVVINGTDGTDGIDGDQGLPGADGADGAAGVDARVVNLTTTSQAFTYLTTGITPSPATATVTATALNTTGTVYYEFFLEGVSQGARSTTNTYTYTPKASYADMPDKIEVQISEDIDPAVLARDQMTMVGVKAGGHSNTIVLSNEAHTLPTTNAGVVTYTGSGTSISVWHGSTQLTVDQNSAYGNGTFRVTAATGTNITPGSPSGADGATERIYSDHSAMTQDSASIDYTIVVKDLEGNEITYHRLQSFAKSIAGATGATGPTGPTGATGAQGIPGTNGIDGVDGNDGVDGGPGPGVVYRGVYDTGTVYYNNVNRRDIVQYSGSYYIYDGASPSTPGAWNAGDWEAFGATFSSVATDILFADLAFINNLGVREFEGTSIGAGDLTGTVETTEGADHVHYVAATPNIVEITLASGSSGYCRINCDSTYQDATWDTSLAQTATVFAGTASYPGITVTDMGSGTLRFTKASGTIGSFSTTDNGIYGYPMSGTQIQAYSPAVAQKETVTLSGTSGMAKIIVNGSNYYATFNETLDNTAYDFAQDNFISGVALSSSANKIILTANPAAAFTMGAVSNHVNTFRGAIKISGVDMWEDTENNDTYGVVKINYKGYNGGYTHKRITIIGGGQGSTVVTIGPSGITGLSAGLDVRQGGLKVPYYGDSTARDAAIPDPWNGMIVCIGGTTNKFQGYVGSTWTNLH